MDSYSLQANHLHVAFQFEDTSLLALEEISFHLKPGKTLALLGESGCGKSLTATSLIRLLPPFTAYGKQSSIVINEKDILEISEREMQGFRGRKIAMIFQEPMSALNPVLSIGQQLKEAIRQHQSLSRKAVSALALELLHEVELANPEQKMRQYPHQLSGGQKQRVAIAMALANRPDILIADEPTTALDVTVQAQILKLLKKLEHHYQMSLLLITHDLHVVRAIADEVCVMYAGLIIEAATVKQFFQQPNHPYSQLLLESLPSFAHPSVRLQVIKGQVPQYTDFPKACRFHPRCPFAFDACKSVAPLLQTLYADHESRLVRCHLYPEEAHLSPEKPPHPSPLPEGRGDDDSCDVMEGRGDNYIGDLPLPLLQVNSLSVHFKNKTGLLHRTVFKAVDDVSLQLHQGKTIALVGESGCGKTTLAKALVKLTPITTGQLLLQNTNVTHLSGKRLNSYRKEVQIIFQDPYSAMNPRMIIRDILAEGMIAQGYKKSVINRTLLEVLDQVNLPQNILHRYPHQFSGGQRQRLCIARALTTKPKIMICDEPTSALDVSVQAQILNVFKDLQQEYGLAYLFITHNMGVVSYMADEVLVMHEGKIVEQGAREQILTSPQHRYTQELIASVVQE